MITPLQLPTKRPFSFRLFLILWIASVVGLVAVLPYTLTLQANTLQALTDQLPFPLWVLLLLQIGQSAILFGVAAVLGLLMACRIGLGLPFMENWLNGTPIWDKLPRVAILAIILGVVSAVALIVIDTVVFASETQRLMEQANIAAESVQPPWWQGLLASLYGGIAEEVLLRLFAMTLFAWLGHFVSKTEEGRPTLAVLWIANIAAALLFGAGHLPAASGMGLTLTPIFIARTLLLNGIIGVIAGWLYHTRGLESAMIAHFSADIVLHVLTPILAGMLS